ncbi:MAG: SDR family NAD(P)-dependent oxidoreductase, partial [Alphaproteobacteria bacterium]|nr:SDR family NAD(P)-dependent oxidoreductase [Alphaproteobacteria bacterium]
DATTKVCDLADGAACERIADELGPVDLLINNAGITQFSRFDVMTPETLRQVMEVNFFGAVNATRAFLPGLKARRGAIIAIASVAGFAPLYARSAYAASKHAMIGFFSTLGAELAGDGVHVLIACPSFIATQETARPANAAESGMARPGSARRTAGTPLSPEDVAEAILAGLAARKRLLPIGRTAWLSYWLSRLAPGLFERAMLRATKDEVG